MALPAPDIGRCGKGFEAAVPARTRLTRSGHKSFDAFDRRMTPQESALLDQSLSVDDSALPLGLSANTASIHRRRPARLAELQAWRDDYDSRYPRMLGHDPQVLER